MYEKIWLAGLGAYGRSEKLGKEGVKLFDELVDEGSEVRDRASERLEDIKQKAKEKIQGNVSKMKELLHIDSDQSDIRALSQQVEELSAAVHALALKPASPASKKVVGKTAGNQRGKSTAA